MPGGAKVKATANTQVGPIVLAGSHVVYAERRASAAGGESRSAQLR